MKFTMDYYEQRKLILNKKSTKNHVGRLQFFFKTGIPN